MNHNIEMIKPTQYEIERIQILAYMAYGVFDGTKDSVGYLMRDMVMFYESYSDAMEEAEKVITGKAKTDDKIIDSLVIVSLCLTGLDLLLTHKDNSIYELAKELLKDVDIEKEFSDEMRMHVATEMKLRIKSEEVAEKLKWVEIG